MATLYDLFNQNQVETNSVFFSLFVYISKPHLCTHRHIHSFFFAPEEKKMRSASVCCMQMANACEYFHLKLSKFVFGKYILACKLCAFEWFCRLFFSLTLSLGCQCCYCGLRKSIPEHTSIRRRQLNIFIALKGKYSPGRHLYHFMVLRLCSHIERDEYRWIDTDKGNDLKFTGPKTVNLC